MKTKVLKEGGQWAKDKVCPQCKCLNTISIIKTPYWNLTYIAPTPKFNITNTMRRIDEIGRLEIPIEIRQIYI